MLAYKIKTCPNKCFVVLLERTDKKQYFGYLWCSSCGYMEEKKKK